MMHRRSEGEFKGQHSILHTNLHSGHELFSIRLVGLSNDIAV